MAIQPFPIGLPTGIPIDALREQAKELLKSVQAGEPVALDRIKPYFRDPAGVTLQRIQLVIARERGFSSWRKLKDFADARDEMVKQRREGFPTRSMTQNQRWEIVQQQDLKLRPIVQRMADAIERDEPDPAARRCSFCFKSQHQVPKFIAGTNVYICNECVDVGAGLVGADEGQGEVQAGQEHEHCSFCEKPLGKVETIIAGPGTNICNECVELCVTIITEGTQADSS